MPAGTPTTPSGFGFEAVHQGTPADYDYEVGSDDEGNVSGISCQTTLKRKAPPVDMKYVDIGKLRAENAALRKRIAELEGQMLHGQKQFEWKARRLLPFLVVFIMALLIFLIRNWRW